MGCHERGSFDNLSRSHTRVFPRSHLSTRWTAPQSTRKTVNTSTSSLYAPPSSWIRGEFALHHSGKYRNRCQVRMRLHNNQCKTACVQWREFRTCDELVRLIARGLSLSWSSITITSLSVRYFKIRVMLNKLKVYNKPEDLAICLIVSLLSRLFPFKVVRTGTLTPVECISRQTEISGNLGQISACRLFLLHVLREVHSVS